MAGTFKRVGADVSFPDLEERVLAYWDEIDAFRTSVEMRSVDSEYTFYDGPPFPTGSPHYGNLLAGVLKDIVPRYWTMRGHRVVRRFGWDTHGLPIEMAVEKQLGLSGPRQISEYGIDRFNEACRALVQANTEQWEKVTRRLGRWVDFRDDYKTMDLTFMESVWWAFQQLWEKGLVYRAFKVLPYSWGAATPLSNFEANMDYREVDDPAITVRLRLRDRTGTGETDEYVVVWTTTPWTLPGNLAVAVGPDIEYVLVAHNGARYWVAADLADRFFPGADPVARAPGTALLGREYDPPFTWFAAERERGAFRIVPSPDVHTEEGTGLVHMAPAYGEADFYALRAAGVDVLVDPVDAKARFTAEVPELAGLYVKDADARIIDMLRERGLIVRREQIRHSYPFCWRTETPLIYKAIPTWFVAVETFRDRMVELNKKIHWVPAFVGERRFGNWLQGARDWAISRNRYWGSCIPVWQCIACGTDTCIGSIDELAERSGVRVNDLHKHVVDKVTIPCPKCFATARRVPEVLDCWFESGSMPYAENHYPFENAARFDRRFPADFIAEGLDQTRAWFYTLLVLSTALFDEIPFRNCVVNGLILAEDGQKMSKSKRNYPDPLELVGSVGADALRAFLVNSPVVRAEPLRFSEAGVRDVVRTVMLPLWNAYSFFTTYAEADGIGLDALDAAPPPAERPEMDRWVLSVLQSLVRRVNEQMEGYYLYAVIPPMVDFIEDLTNWYIRRSRRRFWRSRSEEDADKLAAFATLYEVLVTFAQVMAPVLPFVTEEIYQGLVVRTGVVGSARSVHHTDYPVEDRASIDTALEHRMAIVRQIVSMGRALRVEHGLKVRQPLSTLTVVTRDAFVAETVTAHADLIEEELNVKAVLTSDDEEALVHLAAKPNFRVLGPRYGARMREAAAAIEALSAAQVRILQDGGREEVIGDEIGLEDIVVVRTPREGVVVVAVGPLSVALDTALTRDLRREGLAREIVSRVQQLRREAGLDVTDRIVLSWSSPDAEIEAVFGGHGGEIGTEVLAADVVRADDLDCFQDVNGHAVALEVKPTGQP